jgi:hypothetical protein
MPIFPKSLPVRGDAEFILPSGRTLGIPKALLRTDEATGRTPSPRNSPEAGPADEPLESLHAAVAAALLRILQADGWEGVTLRTGVHREPGVPTPTTAIPSPPPFVVDVLRRIHEQARSPQGDWDIVCWRDREILFAVVRRHGRERLAAAKLGWLEAAFLIGLTHDSFLVVEWDSEVGDRFGSPERKE